VCTDAIFLHLAKQRRLSRIAARQTTLRGEQVRFNRPVSKPLTFVEVHQAWTRAAEMGNPIASGFGALNRNSPSSNRVGLWQWWQER